MAKFKLEIVSDDVELMHDSLGISADRKKQLVKLVKTAAINYSSKIEAANYFLAGCTHINEAWFCIYLQAELDLKDSIWSTLTKEL